MRESNFAFPAQNKACVCITSQLYDRRALDTTSPLPLFNSLTHLTYLTSTSPRIREIMTMDGGLERLVRLLHEFCICPPPPENPSLFYGLAPPTARPPKLLPTLNPPTFDKHAAYRFSLAFQCVVNIGVRGSEPIRSRVVQAGTLDVVGCILEAWLAHKGFAVGPNSQGAGGAGGNGYGWGGYIRESREQRHARRQHRQQMLRDVEEAAELARALQRQMNHTETAVITNGNESSIVEENEEQDSSADASTTVTPAGASTPTTGVDGISGGRADTVTTVTNGRDRSGTVIARTSWDPLSQVHSNHAANASQSGNFDFDTARSSPSPSVSSNEQSRPSSRLQSETEDDADVDMDGPVPASASTSASTSDIDAPSPDRRPSRHRTHRPSMTRRSLVGLGLGGDQVPPMNMNMTMGGMNLAGMGDAHIIINDSMGGAEGLGTMGDVGVNMGIGGGMTGEDGIVSLDIEANDDFAMGAPPGAPGAIPAANMGDVTLGLDGDLSMSETEEGSRPASRGAGMDLDRDNSAAMDRSGTIRRRHAPGTPDATPRAGVIGLPPSPVTTSGAASGSRTVMSASNPASPSIQSSSNMGSFSASQNNTIRANGGGSRAGILNNAAESSRSNETEYGTVVPWHMVANAEAFFADRASGMTEEEVLARHRERRRATEDLIQRAQLRQDDLRRDADERQTSTSSPGTNARHHHRSTDDTQHTAETDRPTTSPNALAQTATPGTTRSTASTISLASTTATASTSTLSHSLPPSPYRDEDVLLSLQLLAYLSKYPHVRQAFYKKRDSFHPASVIAPNGSSASSPASSSTAATATAGPSKLGKERERDTGKTIKESSSSFFRAFANATSRGKEKERSSNSSKIFSSPSVSTTSSTTTTASPTPLRQTNVFSLVERFTYRPSSSEVAEYSANGNGVGIPPRLPPEIQYWAGVIMRNACRKDDSRGGIRQCANMLCGRWEEYPREFAKCRRCRKAKYCGKECQSTAWSEGHRFWCSARDADDEAATAAAAVAAGAGESSLSQLIPIVGEDQGRVHVPVAGNNTGTDRRERRERERHGERRDRTHGYAHDSHTRDRARGFDAVVGSGRQLPNNSSGATSRTGATEAGGHGLLPRESQNQNQRQIVPSQARGRFMMADPTMYADFLRHNGHASETNEGGRRRADTVTGAVTIGSSTTVRSDLTIPPYNPSANQRSHGQQRDVESEHLNARPRAEGFSRVNPARNDSAGTSASTAGNGDSDMLLG